MSTNGLIKIEGTDVCIIKHKDGYPSYIKPALEPLLEAIRLNQSRKVCGYYQLDPMTLVGGVAKALALYAFQKKEETIALMPDDDKKTWVNINNQSFFLSGHCITTIDKAVGIDHTYTVMLDGKLKIKRGK
jgi:hypothetical protein